YGVFPLPFWCSFFYECSRALRHLHSFPTRRSSDLGIPSALSSSNLPNFKIIGLTIFHATDFLVSNIMLPVGCLMIALFIGYGLNRPLMKEELLSCNYLSLHLYNTWFQIMRWVVPITIGIIFLISLNLL